MTRTRAFVGAALALGLGAVLQPTPVAACGGFFCNRQAIDQSGEDILFVFNDDGTVTTVVQIAYEGPSEDFAWILPVPEEPQVDVGTNALFVELERRTAPRYLIGRSTTVGACRAMPDCWGDELFGAAGEVPAPDADSGGRSDPDGGVEVLQQASVGPYDFAVLRSGDADALRGWLTDNGYFIPSEAGGELDHYVALDHFFVALRLQKNATTGEIQPIVLRSANREPCIPIRLTRIATVENLPVKAYFLAEHRVRPVNYELVAPDEDDESLWITTMEGGFREAYDRMVTRVVDDAGGHAFVTDFAGPSPTLSLQAGTIDHLRSVTDVEELLQGLLGAGIRGDRQLLAIFERHLPPPPGVEATAFYDCLASRWCDTYDDYARAILFDAADIVDEVEETVLAPRRQAQAWFDRGGWLTRLYTTLSGDEMDVDPAFMPSSQLHPDVSRVHEAEQRIECSPEYFWFAAPRTLILASGREVPFREGVAYPGTDQQFCEDYWGVSDGMPFHPAATEAELRATAAARSIRPGGGALCAARPGRPAAGFGAALLLGLAGFVLAGRRRSG
ncbi:MAG: DUF2330 domain-containing protein [Sandaracinaceae bacterium]